jgi:hypothetical protein
MLLFRVLWWAMRSRLTWFAAGAVLMWLFDPDHGDARRARLSGQVGDDFAGPAPSLETTP